MSSPTGRIVVAIATPIEQRLIAGIAAVDDRLDVRYEPRGAGNEARWKQLLADAEIVFGIPGDALPELTHLVRTSAELRWVQMAESNTYEQLREAGLSAEDLDRMPIIGTNGSQAGPLAELAMFGILAFAKQLPQLLTDAKDRHWHPHPMSDLAGKSMLVIGLGPVGIEVARLAKAFGMHVSGVNRNGRGKVPGVDIIRPARFLADLLPVAHAVVLTLPLTQQTRGLIDARAVSRMRADSIFVNIGHGGVVDEPALIQGLEQGQPAAAVLNAFSSEPLPPHSPLWKMSNVLISPHTAAQSTQQTERMVGAFTDNLRRYLRGDELIGRIGPTVST